MRRCIQQHCRRLVGVAVFMLACLLSTNPQFESSLQAQTVSQQQIDLSVEAGLSSLREYDYRFKPVTGLVVYTLLAGDEPRDSPAVMAGLNIIERKFTGTDGVYKPLQHHIYEAGIDALALEKADPVGYQPQLTQIVNYLIETQFEHGGWYYPEQKGNFGDTSISQYAILGLWAAQRAGVDIPEQCLGDVASWHLKTRLPQGAFSYHPGGQQARRAPQGTMTVAGTGSLGIVHLMLFGDRAMKSEQRSGAGLKFGILEPTDRKQSTTRVNRGELQRLRPGIKQAVEEGKNWITNNFDRDCVAEHDGFLYYYYYALERSATINGWTMLGSTDWYQRGAQVLLSKQSQDGSWGESVNRAATAPSGTCFSLLFLMRATEKLVPKTRRPKPLGEGVLAGGRGLPDDLSSVQFRNGKVQSEQVVNDFDSLLGNLAMTPIDVADGSTNNVEKVDLSSPKKLIGQLETCVQLARHSDPRVRQVAAWAIGRTDQLAGAQTLVELLADEDLDVVVEARLALCWIARRPNGWDHAIDPRKQTSSAPAAAQNSPDETEVATTPQAVSAEQIGAWRKAVQADWKAWFLRQRPYQFRDDFQDPQQLRFRQ